jgi:PilZ domain-containing protein
MHSTATLLAQHAALRKYRRFDLRCAVFLRFSAALVTRELEGISKDVSVGGVLLNSGDQVPLHTRVSLQLEVVGPRFRHPVRLTGEGEVVRVEFLNPALGYAIAIECSCPMIERRRNY